MKIKRRHSLSGKLLGLFFLTGLMLAGVVNMGFELAIEDSFRKTTRPHLDGYVQYLLDDIGDPPSREKATALAARLPLDIHWRGPDGSWSSDGEIPDMEDFHWHRHPRRLPSGHRVRMGFDRGQFAVEASSNGYRILLQPAAERHTPWAPLALVLTIAGVLAVLALAYHLIGRLFRPLQTVRVGLSRIGDGELQHRISIRRRDELGELADSVNLMADDIQHMLEAKRQLLLAISHELRSPLTRARVNLALLPESEVSADLRRDLTEMETLTSELLESERLNSRHAPLNLSAENPAGLARELLEESFGDENIELNVEADIGYVALDPVRFKLLLRNLLDNAIKHTPESERPPRLSLKTGAQDWRVEVRDWGGGIAAEHLKHITEPFYRADPSRQRKTGGYGLGLYLCRVIVDAHGGELRVESSLGEGTCITAVFGARP